MESLGRALDIQRPWPRIAVSQTGWAAAIAALTERRCTLAGLWSDGAAVHMALIEPQAAGHTLAVVSLPSPDRRFPSLAAAHAPAGRLERTLCDLWGLEPVGAPDTRPWLDHGHWDLAHPLGALAARPEGPQPYAFLPAEGAPLHQIPVGPVHAGIIEPGHFRFHANGETVVRLEARLGYVHKGIEGLLRGASLAQAARLTARASGDSTVAYAWAFAAAVEAAAGIEAPPRAVAIRAVMAELERIANHLGDVGAICNDAAFSLMHAQCGALRERVLRAAGATFGHRLMMDRIVPGGVAADVDPAGAERIAGLLADLRRHLPPLVALYDGTASLQDRTVTTGIVTRALADRFGAGGHVGRASGRAFDARRALAYAPYNALAFRVPVREAGDVDARVWIRIEEVGESLAIIDTLLENLPEGPLRADLAPLAGAEGREGIALIESFRGDVLAWVRLGAGGRIGAAHLRDPSVFQWPLLEAAIEGNIVADFPLCNKSFNCSYAGHDL